MIGTLASAKHGNSLTVAERNQPFQLMRCMQAAATTCADMKAYRTEIPDRFVYILAAMFMDASSWKRSLAA